MTTLSFSKVRFCQKVLMFLSCLQMDKQFTFLNLKIWILLIFKGCPSQPNAAFSPLKTSKLSNFKSSSITKQFSVTKIQTLKFRKMKCSTVSYDKNIIIFWRKRTFKRKSLMHTSNATNNKNLVLWLDVWSVIRFVLFFVRVIY